MGGMDLFILLFISLGVFWGISVALDRLFDEKQCPHCREWTNARHMIEYIPDKLGAEPVYYHTACFLLHHPGQSPLPDNE